MFLKHLAQNVFVWKYSWNNLDNVIKLNLGPLRTFTQSNILRQEEVKNFNL